MDVDFEGISVLVLLTAILKCLLVITVIYMTFWGLHILLCGGTLNCIEHEWFYGWL